MYIVSFTTFTPRFKFVPTMIKSLLAQTFKDFRIVMTLYKDDVPNLTDELKKFIDSGTIELLIADENLKPNLKYYYCMLKYRDIPIITVDDDRIYSPNLIEILVNTYEHLDRKAVVSHNCCHMHFDRNTCITRYSDWNVPWSRTTSKQLSYLLFAEGFEGKLYPPNAFAELENYKDMIIKPALREDDVATKALELINKLPVCSTNIVKYPYFDNYNEDILSKDIAGTNESALATNEATGLNYRNEIIFKFNAILCNALFLEGTLVNNKN